jgi:hypothetical protein
MDKQIKNILIIGVSETGKTHFGGQLYGRLDAKKFEFELGKTPSDYGIFKDILIKLSKGLAGDRTNIAQHKTIPLHIISKSGIEMELNYPDYGGEQIIQIVKNRKLNDKWKDAIEKSNHWFLFIRIELIEKIIDITDKFFESIETNKNVTEFKEISTSASVFYVELLQIFLSIKNISIQSKNKPKLTVILTCWDKLNQRGETKPANLFKKKLPLLFSFIQSNWENNFNIIGLSSTGKDLHKEPEKADKEYENKNPIDFGYYIDTDGRKEEDITKIMNFVL